MQTNCEIFNGCDVTPLSHPDHHAVGKEFLGTHYGEDGFRTIRWFCVAHDRQGYWMMSTDGSGVWTNISERAVQASFWKLWIEDSGWAYCPFGWVPNYDHKTFHNARFPNWIGHNPAHAKEVAERLRYLQPH